MQHPGEGGTLDLMTGGLILGYARVSTDDQDLTTQRAAKARGVKFGPRPTLTPAQIEHARRLIDQDGYTVKDAAALLGVHRSTLYRAINKTAQAAP